MNRHDPINNGGRVVEAMFRKRCYETVFNETQNNECSFSRRARFESNERLWARPGKVAFARVVFNMVLICRYLRYILAVGRVAASVPDGHGMARQVTPTARKSCLVGDTWPRG